MLVNIDRIIVGDRIRKDFGDIGELADDIRENGLINPPTVNKDYVLLAGERRLRACKSLGWTQIEVHMLDTKDEAHDLAVEMSENNMRRNFTGSELADGIRRQMAIEAEKAKERMESGGVETFPQGSTGKARDKAGEAFGISGKQAEKVLFVADNRDLLDPADFADWDEGKLSTNKAFQRIKAAQAKAIEERKRAERELRQASVSITNAQMEAESLRQQVADARAEVAALEKQNDQLYAQAHPKPKVVERTVEVESEASKKRISDLEHERDLYLSDLQKLRKRNSDLRDELDKVNDLLGESDRTSNARRDIEQLTIATNSYLRNYGGRAWAFDQFDRVDEPTQQEFIKAITSLSAFAQNLAQMIQDKKQLGANND